MTWRYDYHAKAKFGMSDEELERIPERVTKLSFDQWKALYNGDPEHWIVCENSNFESGKNAYRLPVYRKDRFAPGGKYHQYDNIYIKFLTATDYQKYNQFIDELEEAGEDYQNMQEILALSEYIGKIAEQRLAKAQEKMQQAIEDNQRLMKQVEQAQAKEFKLDEKGRLYWR